MATVVTVHSFHQGTGRSTLIARLATLLAAQGRRVGLFEADLLHPTLCPLFGLPEDLPACTANKYLRGECAIEEAAFDLTPALGAQATGALYIIPASVGATDILQTLRERFDAQRLRAAFEAFAAKYALDILLIDAPAGENEASLVSTAICDTLVVVLRLDHVDYLGTGIVIDVARQLQTSSILLVANRVDAQFEAEMVRAKLAETYRCEVGAIVPESSWMSSSPLPLSSRPPDDDPAASALLELASRVASCD